jgi:translocator protein
MIGTIDRSNALKLILAIAICWAPGLLGSVLFATGDDNWYQQLDKPFFNPPSWLFGPVWSVLYIFMGVSLYLIWIRGERARHWYALIVVFFIQLMLNGFWTPAFFGMESPLAGLTVIVPLWFMIVATIWLARNFSLPASLLLVPYLLWVSFAMVLNALIWYLN